MFKVFGSKIFVVASAFRILVLSILVVARVASATSVFPTTREVYSYLDYLRFAEQRMNDKIENTDIFASIKQVDLEKQFRPESESSFPLISVLIPKSQVVVVQTGDKLPLALQDGAAGDRIRFLVHPKSFNAFSPYLDSAYYEAGFEATPLGSYRSLIVWKADSQSPPFNLKVSLDVEIGSARRMLSKGQIQSAAITSLILKQGNPARFTERGINIIDEPYSVYLKDFPYGFTFRDLPELPPGNQLVPLFSLYSVKNPMKKSLLSDVVARSFQNPMNTLQTQLIRPLVKHFVFFAMTEGLVSEPHEQNVMVELKDGQLTGRFFYRDLAGFNVSAKYRKSIGKDLSFVPAAYKESIHEERTDIVQNFESYLINSNFFAMSKSVPKTSHEEVSRIAREVFLEEMGRWVGTPVRTMAEAKRTWKLGRESGFQGNICSRMAQGRGAGLEY